MSENVSLPRHIGFIVDGNRRWAKQHGLPTYEGHLAGYNALKDVALEVLHRGVKYASAYVFSTENLSDQLIKAIDEAEEKTADLKNGELVLCLNYGGHLEIADAVKKIVQSGVSPEEITPELIAQNIYAPEVPPCDLIVRTSSEQRLSNFMLWRSAYSELMFIEKNWPDMTIDDVSMILEEYANRNRRFGK